MDLVFTSLLTDPRLHLATADTMAPPSTAVPHRIPLAPGHFHEWFLTGDFPGGAAWYPPLTILAALAWQAVAGAARGRIVWIGRRCWPTFQLLSGLGDPGGRLLSGSVFLDPLTDIERFWAIGQAFGCSAIGAVVADGSRLTPTASRRLQLAAEKATVLGLVARPPWEIGEPTYAATRWDVSARAVAGEQAGWAIKLHSCRGQQRGQDVPQNWTADWSYQVFRGTGALHVLPGLGRGTAAPPIGGAQARSRTA